MAIVDRARLLGLLNRLEGHWVRQGADIVSTLRPGLSDTEIDALMAPLGLPIPEELRIWWSWHDGSSPIAQIGVNGWDYEPLHVAIENYRLILAGPQTADTGEPALADCYWRHTWFPITSLSLRELLFVDTALTQPGETIPVRRLDAMWERYTVDQTSSFTDTVQIWVDALDAGYYYWSSDHGGGWQSRYAEMPLELRLSGVL